MPQQIILRKGTAAAWTSAGSVVLAAGEPGFETDTGKFKIGNGTQAWTLLPYAVGTIPVNLADLADVTSDAPSTGEVLKWNGTAWAPAADSTGGGTGATYAISAETATGGANLRLTGSDASTDDVKIAAGTGITVTRTDGNTITITSDVTDNDTTYSIDNSTSGDGVDINLLGSDSGTSTVSIQPGTDVYLTSINDNVVEIGSASYSLTTTQEIGGGGATFAKTELTRTLDGVAAAQNSLLIRSLDNNLVVTASQTGGTNTVTIANPSRINAATTGAGEVAIYTGGVGVTTLNPQSVLSIGTVTETATITGNLIIQRDTYSASSQAGLLFKQHHATADAVGLNFYRTRGTGAAPTTIVSGDDIIDIGFLGHDGTNPTAVAGLSVITTGTISTGIVPAKFQFNTRNQAGVFAARVEISAEGVLQCNTFANLTGSDITFSPSGVVRLPAGSTVGGVLIGSIVIKGTVATSASLPGGAAAGDAYIALSPTPTKLWSWNGSAWVDLGTFQGPAGTNGTNGQGVPTGGIAGQVLAKIDSSNYNTQWSTLATVATSGAYGDLSGTPTLPNSFATIAVSGQSNVVADSTTDTLTLVAGSGITLTTDAGTDTITIANSASATNSFTTIAVAGQSDVVADSATDTLTLIAGTNITLTTNATNDSITINSSGGGSDTNTTYSIKATTAVGGATLDLDAGGSGSGTDSVTFAGGAGITVARTDASTITVSSSVTDTNTTYALDAIDGDAGKKIIRLTAGGSGSGDDDVVLVAGTNVTLERTGTEITINSTASGGGGSMATRTTATATTASIANGATGNIAITGFKSYALLKIVVEHEAWVRIYTDTASRTADASRAEGVDPTPGSGVIAEVITTAAPQTILISPGTIGFNNEGTPTTSIPIAVTNKSGTTRTITVTLTVLQLEA